MNSIHTIENMPEVNKNYNLNSLYIFWIIMLYNIFTANYEYIKLFVSKIILFNHTSFILVIIITGMYVFLKNLAFEINIKISYN
jgi:hypothetical protein